MDDNELKIYNRFVKFLRVVRNFAIAVFIVAMVVMIIGDFYLAVFMGVV